MSSPSTTCASVHHPIHWLPRWPSSWPWPWAAALVFAVRAKTIFNEALLEGTRPGVVLSPSPSQFYLHWVFGMRTFTAPVPNLSAFVARLVLDLLRPAPLVVSGELLHFRHWLAVRVIYSLPPYKFSSPSLSSGMIQKMSHIEALPHLQHGPQAKQLCSIDAKNSIIFQLFKTLGCNLKYNLSYPKICVN